VALTFLFDVDNTLLDNDRAKAALDARLGGLLGEAGAVRFWELYELVRRETGKVNIPLTMARYDDELERGPMAAAARREQRFALADLVMGFPYDGFVYPGAAAAIARARELGRVAILSEGDATFQPSKIWRSGLVDLVGGNCLVFDQKLDHLDEVVAAFPADHYVLIEDKPTILREVGARLGGLVTTVLVRQGKYGRAPLGGEDFGVVLEDIGGFAAVDWSAVLPEG
jgi:FMN phosphatase YigB (HAD superfamily)